MSTLVKTPEEIVKTFPIKNDNWSLVDGEFTSELTAIEELDPDNGGMMRCDPWGRKITQPLHGVVEGEGEDTEVLYYTVPSSVAGVKVTLKILNV